MGDAELHTGPGYAVASPLSPFPGTGKGLGVGVPRRVEYTSLSPGRPARLGAGGVSLWGGGRVYLNWEPRRTQNAECLCHIPLPSPLPVLSPRL